MKPRRGLASLLIVAAVAACGDRLLGPPPTRDQAATFDGIWRAFDLHYSFFEFKHVNWDSLGAHYRPLAIAAPTDQDFAAVMARMLAELHDVHVSITPFGPGSTLRYVSRTDTARTFFNPRLVGERYVLGMRETIGRHLRYGMMTSAVGYVYIPTFTGRNWAPEIDAVLDELRGATSLVIDIRNNAGGTTTMATDIAGRFADRRRTFGFVRLRNGPEHDAFTDYVPETVAPTGMRRFGGAVYVLTNRRDVSTAEDFVLAMRVLPHVMIVGDTTGGASGGPTVHELANGWTYELSEWIEYTVNRQMFEGTGLAPDVVVKPTAADAEEGVDSVLEVTLTLAQSSSRPAAVPAHSRPGHADRY